MEVLLSRSLNLLSGCTTQDLARRVELYAFAPHTKNRAMDTLHAKGYTELRSFIAFPSISHPRWLLPTTGDRRGITAGMQIYHPHKWAPRVLKRILAQLMRMKWAERIYPLVGVATEGVLPLEKLIKEITGESSPLFALSIGRQAAVCKLTVQVMRRTGEILGYIKLPITEAATYRVRNEAKTIERLERSSALRPYIPRLLYAGNWENSYVLFQSQLEGKSGPADFGGMHERFLNFLWSENSIKVPGDAVVDATASKWKKAVKGLSSEWQSIGREALHRASAGMTRTMLRCGLVHGDFAPWNTRVSDNHLLLFDWESSNWQSPVLWDVFHFHVQSFALLSRSNEIATLKQTFSTDPSLMLYILDSVVQLLEEKNVGAIALRKRLLLEIFQQRGAWIERSIPARSG